MKKIIFIAMFALLCFAAFAQGGVNFEHLTFDEALAKAKTEKKLVFLDCYTTWCGPCKYMSETIFPKKEAGDFFNPRFVCIKSDMEKGEGIELKKRLNVKAYPSFFIIRPDGTVQHSVVGGGELDPFIARVSKGLNEKTSLLYLDKQYEKGKMNSKQLMAYRNALNDAYDREKSKKVTDELLTKLTDKDRLKPEFWPLTEDRELTPFGSDNFKFVLANVPALQKNIGREKVDTYLYAMYSKELDAYFTRRALRNQNYQEKLDQMKKEIAGLDIAYKDLVSKDRLIMKCDLADVTCKQDVAKVIEMMSNVLSTFPLKECGLAPLSVVYEKGTKEDLKKVVELGDKYAERMESQELKDAVRETFTRYKRLANVGVYFEDLTFDQALARAKKEKKMIFMDCYTSWCGPCKNMANNVFPQEKVGDFFNRNFINVKYDMEKGEGPEIAKKFGIQAYPTFLMIKPDGFVQHKIVGGGEADRFIELVKKGLDDKTALGVIESKYKSGNGDKALALQYMDALIAAHDRDAAQKVANELLQGLSDGEKVSESYWFIFDNSDLTPEKSEGYNYLLANQKKFSETIGKERVEARLDRVYRLKLLHILMGRLPNTTTKDIDAIEKEVKALGLSDGKVLISYVNIAKALKSGNADQLLTVSEREFLKLSPERAAPYMVLSESAISKATPAQKKRWIKLGKDIAARITDPDYKKAFEDVVANMEKSNDPRFEKVLEDALQRK